MWHHCIIIHHCNTTAPHHHCTTTIPSLCQPCTIRWLLWCLPLYSFQSSAIVRLNHPTETPRGIMIILTVFRLSYCISHCVVWQRLRLSSHKHLQKAKPTHHDHNDEWLYHQHPPPAITNGGSLLVCNNSNYSLWMECNYSSVHVPAQLSWHSRPLEQGAHILHCHPQPA